MRSRKDQVQAYFFVVSRLVSALMVGRPDPADRPNRRTSVGLFTGVLIALVVLAGFGIWGLIKPGGDRTWRTAGGIVLVKETGARYLMLDGQLRPVLNTTSARLVLGGPGKINSVSQRSLKDVPVGMPVGIPGAPDALPEPARLYRGGWTMCARPPAEPGLPPRTTLMLGGGDLPVMAETSGFLVATNDGTRYLVHQGRRHRIADATVAAALGYGSAEPLVVAPAWLNPLPAGRDLDLPVVDGLGTAGLAVAGRPGLVGQVYRVRNPALGGEELYQLRREGLVMLSRTAASLVLADPALARAYPGAAVEPIDVGPADVARTGVADARDMVDGYPAVPPPQVAIPDGEVPCVHHLSRDGGMVALMTTVRVEVLGSATSMAAPAAPAVVGAPADPTPSGGTTVDEVVIPTGAGVLVRSMPSPAAPTGPMHLVGEFGMAYPVADDESLSALGYQGLAPVDLPNELLAVLPVGPVLSAAAARGGQP